MAVERANKHVLENKPLVSVILPVYNRQDLVRRAIRSVLAQTIDDLELLIIDDCSTDATFAVASEYCSDPRVRVDRNARNLGPAGTRNRGLELARGRYVAFQDSDDRWFPEKLARQIEALERAPDRRACYCGSLYYIPIHHEGLPDFANTDDGELSSAILYSNPVTPQALVVERTLFDELGRFDTAFSVNEDWELAIRLAQGTRFAFVPEPLVVIYRTANSVSSDRIADTAVRQRLLTKHADLFATHPAARGVQNYVIGVQSVKTLDYENAIRAFRQSFRDTPSLRCFIQIQRARVLALSDIWLRRGAKQRPG